MQERPFYYELDLPSADVEFTRMSIDRGHPGEYRLQNQNPAATSIPPEKN